MHLLYFSCLTEGFFFVVFFGFSALKTSPATIKRVWLRKAALLWHVSSTDSLRRKSLGVGLLFPQWSPPPSSPPPPPPLLYLIFIKSFGLDQSSALISWGHRRAVTQANDTWRWGGCSPYNRVWHPVCDGLTQLPCPVSKVNQVKQSVFFSVCRCERLQWVVDAFMLFCVYVYVLYEDSVWHCVQD